MGEPTSAPFGAADEVIPEWAQVAGVVAVEEFRPEFRNVHMDRALRRAGFAGEASGHCLVHLMGKIALALLLAPGVLQSFEPVGDRFSVVSGRARSYRLPLSTFRLLTATVYLFNGKLP